MRRPRYPGRHPRAFHQKYKELQPDRYADEVAKVVRAGKTPAGMHRAIMVDEVVRVLDPGPGMVAVDCTLGYGGHARALLSRLAPGGRLLLCSFRPAQHAAHGFPLAYCLDRARLAEALQPRLRLLSWQERDEGGDFLAGSVWVRPA